MRARRGPLRGWEGGAAMVRLYVCTIRALYGSGHGRWWRLGTPRAPSPLPDNGSTAPRGTAHSSSAFRPP